MDQTLILIKPDGVQRSIAGTIIDRFERRGLKIAAMKLMQVSKELANKHYGIHEGKPFFADLVSYITSSPIVAMVLEGPNAVDVARNSMGETNAGKAAPGTIRGDFALTIGRNLVHGSDSPENAVKEINLFFKKEEIVSYERNNDPWIIES
ncbi:MAG: nucleoside-diphosphate kinase [Chloroflexi bacterium]|jgi:nucleoside-diphosphate kinase|nr:nucleoside-diphosphate kinase [Chloroflexota bacterium]MBT7080307.1 nucleoside-diphosphate kinase [Chloroflexota bacterium]MBT7289998.1 nucleoside-diphosphate kinase [Chloroflexota bacterium]